MTSKKCNQKSIRISDEVLAFVERQTGEGFNQKFENAVYKFSKEEKELDNRIKQKRKEYEELCTKVNKLRNTAFNLQNIENEIKRCNMVIERYIKAI